MTELAYRDDGEIVCTWAVHLIRELQRKGITVRLFGGVGIRLRCAAVLEVTPELSRPPRDIDLVARLRDRWLIERMILDLGGIPNREFNLLNGTRQLMYALSVGEADRIRIDVILDRLEMCHVLELSSRLDLHPLTLSASDLLLSKLQVIAPAERDVKDMLALLAAFDVDGHLTGKDSLEIEYIGTLCGSDWGWYRTVSGRLRTVEDSVTIVHDADMRERICSTGKAVLMAVENAPKTAKWRLRAMLGEWLRWYQIPEESA